MGSQIQWQPNTPERKSWDEHFLLIACLLAAQSTCYRKAVGCVLVTRGSHKIVGSGFNGVPSGWPHCKQDKVARCQGAEDILKEGVCVSNHAEVNALLSARGASADICYLTCAPCRNCVKIMLCTSIQEIIYLRETNAQESDEENKRLWETPDPKLVELYKIKPDLRRRMLRYEIPISFPDIVPYFQNTPISEEL